jgi:hypothetical protein
MSTFLPSTDADRDSAPDTDPSSPPWSHLLQYQFKPGNRHNTIKYQKTDPEIKRLLLSSASAAVAALCEIVSNRRASPEARCTAAMLILERVYDARPLDDNTRS